MRLGTRKTSEDIRRSQETVLSRGKIEAADRNADQWHPAEPILRIVPTKEMVTRTIQDEFGRIGQEAVNWALRVVNCESGYNAYAKNSHSSATGLFQFMPTTYKGNGGQDIYNWTEQIKVAAKMIANHQEQQWECSSKS